MSKFTPHLWVLIDTHSDDEAALFNIFKNLDHTISLERYLTRPKANCFKSKLFSHLLIVISYPNGILTKYELCYSRHLTL